jgi:hypothetical protein
MHRPQDHDCARAFQRFRDPGAKPVAARDQRVPPDAKAGAVDGLDDRFRLLLVGAGIADEHIGLVRHKAVATT